MAYFRLQINCLAQTTPRSKVEGLVPHFPVTLQPYHQSLPQSPTEIKVHYVIY